MADKISIDDIKDIKDEKSFKAWLKDKPVEWARVLASRAALRVMPLALSSYHFDSPELVLRANFVSRTALKFPSRNVSAATSAAYAAATDITVIVGFEAIATASSAVGAAAATRFSAAARSAADAVAKASVGARAASGWESVRTDCAALEENSRERSAGAGGFLPDAAQWLNRQPLWDRQTKGLNRALLPDWAATELDAFAASELAQTTAFGLIVDWYHGVLIGGDDAVFHGETDFEVANQPDEFWQGDPVDVMQRIADIAGWQRGEEKTAKWDFFLSYTQSDLATAERISDVLEEEGYSVFSQFNDMTSGKNFVREMIRGLDGMSRFIPIYSDDYFASNACMDEWSAAYRSKPKGAASNMVPFLIKPCSPPSIVGQVVYTSLVGLSPEQQCDAIIKAIKEPLPPGERAVQRKVLRESSGKDVKLDPSGERLDSAPHPEFDDPYADVDLLNLPEVLRSLIATALAALSRTNCSPGLKAALEAYRDELSARGANCIIDLLRGQMDHIQAELSGDGAQYWCSDAIKKTMENIVKRHQALITHFPLDTSHEKLVRAIEIAPDKLDPLSFEPIANHVEATLKKARGADDVTDDYSRVTQNQLRVARDIINVATPEVPEIGDTDFIAAEKQRADEVDAAKKRRMAELVGRADKSVDVMNKITRLAESDTMRAFADALKRLGDWFW